jgi:hypothetical protein
MKSASVGEESDDGVLPENIEFKIPAGPLAQICELKTFEMIGTAEFSLAHFAPKSHLVR